MVVDNTPEIVGAFVTIIVAFLGIAKIMLSQATKDREADRAERIKLSEAITLMAENSSKVAQATTKGAKEAKERNGHLGEQSIHLAELVSRGNELTSQVITRLEKTADIAAEDRENLNSTDQHIGKQIVDKQIVKGNK